MVLEIKNKNEMIQSHESFPFNYLRIQDREFRRGLFILLYLDIYLAKIKI